MSGWTAKRQIKVLNYFSTLDSSVAISVHTNLLTTHPALTESPAISLPFSAPSYSPTSLPDDSSSPPSSPEPSAPTSGPAHSSLTQPCLVTLTPPPPYPATLAPDLSVAPTPLTRVSFGPVILEALPYGDLSQAPYPLPDISEADELASTTRTTAEDICQAASLQSFIASKQRSTLGALPEAVTHPAATLLQSYVE